MAWKRIFDIYRRRPLLMNMMTFGTTFVAAETTQQIVHMYTSPHKKSINWDSIKRFGIIGVSATGPFLFSWYRVLDTIFPVVAKKFIYIKVLLDLTICSPTTLVIFFTGMSLLEGREDIFAELRAKFLSTYTMSCCFWLPAQAINFLFLPPYTRVAFVGCASFVWVNILCLVKRREIPGIPQSVEISAVAKES